MAPHNQLNTSRNDAGFGRDALGRSARAECRVEGHIEGSVCG